MNAIGRGAGRPPTRVALVLTVLVASLFAGSWPAPAQAGTVPRFSARQALAFWTPARMRRAKPVDTLLPRRSKAASHASRGSRGKGAGHRRHVHRHRSASASAAATPAKSSFELVADPAAPEYRQNGVIFIVTPFGLGRCSGTAVNSPNYSVVITAAHCIREPGRRGSWLDLAWVFVPGYRYGQRPFGVFPARWVDTTKRWRTIGGENSDVGAAVVRPNARGQLLTKAVGGAGIAWGLTARQVFDIHGYPAAAPFDGETQRVCRQRPFLGHDAFSFLTPGPLNLAVDCFVTGGASGGGWTIEGNVLNSVTNYGYEDDKATDFGPYFGKEVGRLFHRAGRVR
ncbi:MAG TPA: hypothetical protein VF245_05490 [Solirubrobacterales bacterium]